MSQTLVTKSIPPAIQRTLAIAAVTMAQITIDSWQGPPKPIADRFARIQKRINSIQKQTQTKHGFSKGAARQFDAWAELIAEHSIKEWMTDDERDFQWAVILWLTALLCYDVILVCPIYGQGSHKADWRQLTAMLWRLAMTYLEKFPAADVYGAAVYEHASNALYSTNYAPPPVLQEKVVRFDGMGNLLPEPFVPPIFRHNGG